MQPTYPSHLKPTYFTQQNLWDCVCLGQIKVTLTGWPSPYTLSVPPTDSIIKEHRRNYHTAWLWGEGATFTFVVKLLLSKEVFVMPINTCYILDVPHKISFRIWCQENTIILRKNGGREFLLSYDVKYTSHHISFCNVKAQCNLMFSPSNQGHY